MNVRNFYPSVLVKPDNTLKQGSNQSDMRAYNERLVITMLRFQGPMSKTEVARRTGLTLQTISVIMRELESEGILVCGEPQRGKVGQPSIPMSLSPDAAFFFGLKIGRRSSNLIMINFLGEILLNHHIIYEFPMPDEIVEFTRASLKKSIAKHKEKVTGRFAGLGIAIPFQIWNWAETIKAPPEIAEAWKTIDIRSVIEQDLSFPVYLENDASAACGGELVLGNKSHSDSFLYFFIGFFIGGGVVLNGSLFSGVQGNAGALGSMPVRDRHRNLRQLIEVASIYTLENKLKDNGKPHKILWQSPEIWDIDLELLAEWIDEAGDGIAQSVVSSVSVIDFREVRIDGWLPRAVLDRIIRSVEEKLATMNCQGIEPPRIVEGTIGPNARALGAACLPLSNRFLAE